MTYEAYIQELWALLRALSASTSNYARYNDTLYEWTPGQTPLTVEQTTVRVVRNTTVALQELIGAEKVRLEE